MSCLHLKDADQPHGIEIQIVDNLFVKQMIIPRKDTLVPQHTHTWDHLSMLAIGSVRVWKDGVLDGDYVAPVGIVIKAGVAHRFLSLEDNTIIYCIHSLHDTDGVEVMKENHFDMTLISAGGF